MGNTSPKKIKPSKYARGQLIESKNKYAEVYMCFDKKEGTILAMKTYKISGNEHKIKENLDTLKHKMEPFLHDLKHDHLLRYYDVELKEEGKETTSNSMEVNIIMEYATGPILSLVKGFPYINERLISDFTRQILEGLGYLHSKGFLHKNLKASNALAVFSEANPVVKLCDMDPICRVKHILQEKPEPDGDNHSDLLANSVYWSAPEVLLGKDVGTPADVWSVACVVYEMLTGLPPWSSKSVSDASKLITSGTLPDFPEEISENCRDFLNQALRVNPDERATIQQLLDHSFIGLKKASE